MSNFKPNYFQRRSKPQGPKANERIRALDVQVIGSDGGNLGTMPLNKAIEIAKQEGLDLIEISPNYSLRGWSRVIFLGSLAFICLGIGVFFLIMGAGLILPFAGLEVIIVFICFGLSFRWSQQKEIIYISNDKIKLEQGRLIKENSWEEFRSFVVLEVETDQYNSNQFCFQSKGKRFYFGSFLNDEDKLILKNELKRIINQLNALSPGL